MSVAAALGGPAGGTDVLIVVPPVTRITLSAYGPHLLQAIAAARGHRVRVLYGSLSWAGTVGPDWCEELARIPCMLGGYVGERLFARAAHGLPPLGHGADRIFDIRAQVGEEKWRQLGGLPMGHPSLAPVPVDELLEAERCAFAWVDETARAIAGAGFRVVGCSTCFDQTNASLALLRAVKAHRPETTTLIGGSNCADGLHRGILALDPDGAAIDHLFAGEAEETFPAFLDELRAGRRPVQRVIEGRRCLDVEQLPLPCYDEYIEQHALFVGASATRYREQAVQYENSRGCFLGAEGACDFCGLNGEDRRFRSRAPGTTAHQVAELHRRHPDCEVFLTDNILSDRTLRALADAPSGARLFAQVAPRTSSGRARRFARAGFFTILPGFESLDTGQLRAMGKKTRASDNVLALRRLLAEGVSVFWNLLWGFPGEDPLAYRRMAELIPRLVHLPPPASAWHVFVARESPYHREPERFGIRAVRPLRAYQDIFPDLDTEDIATAFVGDYDAPAYTVPDDVRSYLGAADRWRERWSGPQPPLLHLLPMGPLLSVVDTRDGRAVRVIDEETARLVLRPRPLDDDSATTEALEQGWGVALDGLFVPLIVADSALLARLGVED